jgi:type I restriction enzyme, S subunit
MMRLKTNRVNDLDITQMTNGLKPYPEYKDSGVPWFGEIPKYWEMLRLGALLRERGETNDRLNVDQVLSVLRGIGVIPYEEKGHIGNKRSEDIRRYKIVRPNDIVVNCMNVIIGSVGLSRYTGCLSPVYYVLTARSEEDDPRYLNYIFQTKLFQRSLVRIGNGILAHRMRIPMELLKCELLPRPPKDEQSAIVRYLDHANRRIDRYIRAKRKLIALLNEQKQVIIQQAVTRGLDPNVRLKPSGVEWLGNVPEHWDVRTVRRVISFITSGSRGWAEYYSDTGDLFIQSGNLGRSLSLNLERVQHVNTPKGAEGLRTKVNRDDVLVCATGALTGNVIHVDVDLPDAYVNQHVALLRPIPNVIVSRFLAYVLHSGIGKSQFKTAEYGGTKQGLGLDDVRDVLLPFPSYAEQHAIVNQLDHQMESFQAAIARVQHEIDLIREYRTRLIADVVTGKIDVREAAQYLPVAAIESEILGEVEALAEEDEDTETEELETVAED